MKQFKMIGFDADDTLWENQLLFDETEELLCRLVAPYATPEEVADVLFDTEMKNMEIYKYGVKPYILSVIETALEISNKRITASEIGQLIERGKYMLNAPLILMKGVEETLKRLQPHYSLIVVTKGDLLDQQRKVTRSGLASYFNHVEIMPDKTVSNYRDLFCKYGLAPEEFLMVGNSIKSDILPVLELGGKAIQVPCERVWQHEHVETTVKIEQLSSLDKLPDWLEIPF